MRTYTCRCDATLFFDNTVCLACQRPAGWCEPCGRIVGLDDIPADAAALPGATHLCPAGHAVVRCGNGTAHDVCNRWITPPAQPAAPAPPPPSPARLPGPAAPDVSPGPALCVPCTFNRVIPDLTAPEHRELWAAMEAAKRRAFYDLDLVGLPEAWFFQGLPALSFDFKSDAMRFAGRWVPAEYADEEHPITTGHAAGLITINLKEADPVERERTKLDLGESQRTLVGHFRHELGHYVYDRLVRDQPDRQATFLQTFGDPEKPTYADAMQRHYDQAHGPPADWPQHFVTQYASMHPWEDWAETWTLLLNVAGTLDTAAAHEAFTLPQAPDVHTHLDDALNAYLQLGPALNEMNRHRGLPPVVIAQLPDPVRHKLHTLAQLIVPSAS